MPRLHDEHATRRRILKAGLAVVGGAVAIASAQAGDSDSAANRATEQPPPERAGASCRSPSECFTPEAVHYQAAPNDWQKCLYCAYFRAPDNCDIISAPVSPDGWCDHFTLLHT
jgi:hypothetical protein